jgi:hypothetical protein
MVILFHTLLNGVKKIETLFELGHYLTLNLIKVGVATETTLYSCSKD